MEYSTSSDGKTSSIEGDEIVKMPDGLRAGQMLLSRIGHPVLNIYVYSPSFEKVHQISFNQLSSTKWTRFFLLKIEMLFAVECIDIEVTLKKSGIFNFHARRIMIAS